MSDLWVLDSTDDAADFRLLTPAEFADIARREGWVKLEDFDQEDVRKLMERSISRGCGCDPLARQVLAALDPEDTDV